MISEGGSSILQIQMTSQEIMFQQSWMVLKNSIAIPKSMP